MDGQLGHISNDVIEESKAEIKETIVKVFQLSGDRC